MKCVGRGRMTWGEGVKDDMKLLGLQPKWAIFRDMWTVERLDMEQSLTLVQRGRRGSFQINDDDDDDDVDDDDE